MLKNRIHIYRSSHEFHVFSISGEIRWKNASGGGDKNPFERLNREVVFLGFDLDLSAILELSQNEHFHTTTASD